MNNFIDVSFDSKNQYDKKRSGEEKKKLDGFRSRSATERERERENEHNKK